MLSLPVKIYIDKPITDQSNIRISFLFQVIHSRCGRKHQLESESCDLDGNHESSFSYSMIPSYPIEWKLKLICILRFLAFQVRADDADEGPNSEIRYSLSGSFSSTVFRMDPVTGKISLIQVPWTITAESKLNMSRMNLYK